MSGCRRLCSSLWRTQSNTPHRTASLITSFVCEDGLDEKLNLPSSVQIQIYRMAQEALSNICRHANAKHVKMSVSVSGAGEFDLEIEDDGRGFDGSGTKKKPGRGVANIRARASMIDGEVEWKKRDGGGTKFKLSKLCQSSITT